MSTTDSDEVNYEAQYDQIEQAAQDQVKLLNEDLANLLKGDNIYDQRKDFAADQLAIDATGLDIAADQTKLEKDAAYTDRETALRESRITGIAQTDDINAAIVKSGFTSGPSGDRARRMLTDSLQVKAESGDLTYLDSLTTADIDFKADIADFQGDQLSYQEDIAEADNDLYEALRALQSEITMVQGEAAGATGRGNIAFEEFDWEGTGYGGWDDLWESFES